MQRSRILAAAAAAAVVAGIAWLTFSTSQPPTAPAHAAGPKPSRPPPAPPSPPAAIALPDGSTPTASPGPLPVLEHALRVEPVPAKAEVIVEGGWGSKPGQFGRRHDAESNPEGPMAVIPAPNGDVLVVDQINHRVQRFHDGKPAGAIPTGSDTVQDLAIGPEGRTVQLDRLVDRSVSVHGPDGKLINEAPIAGKGVPDPGAVTGVFADREGIWVEREHGTLVRVADPNGNALPDRAELPGRPTPDGGRVVAVAIASRESGDILVTAFDRQTLAPLWSRTVSIGAPILHLLMQEADPGGNIYVAADVGREGPEPPFPILDEAIAVVRLDPDGTPTGAIRFPPLTSGDETHRPLSVSADGSVVLLRPGESGVSVERYRF